MPEPTVCMQASQISAPITFISICVGLVVFLLVMEVIDGLFSKKKRRK